MLNRKVNILSKCKQISAIILLCIFGISDVEPAKALTADDVMNKMEKNEGNVYLAGVVEGLAYSRWLRDNPSDVGMKCIYDWFYQSSDKVKLEMYDWFERHPDKHVGPLMFVLIKKECGE